MTEPLEQQARDPLVDDVVLRHQDPQGPAGERWDGLRRSPPRPQRLGDREPERGGLHRLRQVPQRETVPVAGSLPQRGQQQQRQPGGGRPGAQLPGQDQAVHVRHVHVEQDHVVAGAAVDRGERVRGSLVVLDDHLPALQLAPDDEPVRGVVVDDQGAAAGHLGRCLQQLVRRARPGRQVDQQGEGGAGAGRAVDDELAVHRLRQAPADRQAQAGPAVLPGRRGVDLGEGAEQPVHPVGGDADAGVPHREGQPALVRAHRQDDLAGGGELHGVAEQVHEHLAQPGGVADEDGRQAGGQVARQVEALGAGLHGDQVQRALHAVAQREGPGLQLQLARLDLGEVQDVVDDRQQGVTAAPDGLGVVALLGVQRGVEQQAAHADDGVHRGADLVAHGGEEGRLGRRGGLRLVPGGVEVGLATGRQGALGGQGPRHLVQALADLPQLRRSGPWCPRPELAVAQPPDGGEQPFDGGDDVLVQAYELTAHDDDDDDADQHLEHQPEGEQGQLAPLGAPSDAVGQGLRLELGGPVVVEQGLALGQELALGHVVRLAVHRP